MRFAERAQLTSHDNLLRLEPQVAGAQSRKLVERIRRRKMLHKGTLHDASKMAEQLLLSLFVEF